MHEARKDLKKLRALLRLVRDAIDDEAYARENARYRDAGRALAGARDAQVKLETIEALRADDPRAPAASAIRAYLEALESERDAHGRPGAGRDATTARAVSEIEAGRTALAGWAPAASGWELVAGGLARGYRRGRNRLDETRTDPSAEHVHEWRKRVKDLWYHLRILRPLWPQPIDAAAEEAHRLSEYLGDHHDLAVLAADARARRDLFAREQELESLLAAAERRQSELLGAALALGERVYAERPKAFVRRFAAYWSAWRAG